MVLEDEKGKEYDAIYIGKRTGLSGGWRGFSLDHNLEDGDALIFELSEPERFKVPFTLPYLVFWTSWMPTLQLYNYDLQPQFVFFSLVSHTYWLQWTTFSIDIYQMQQLKFCFLSNLVTSADLNYFCRLIILMVNMLKCILLVFLLEFAYINNPFGYTL